MFKIIKWVISQQSTCSRILQRLHVLHSWVTQSHAESLEEIIWQGRYWPCKCFVSEIFTVVPVCEALTTAMDTVEWSSLLGLKSQEQCMRVDPTVLSPLSKQVVHEWALLNPFILHTAAWAGRSTVQVNIPLHILTPSGVDTLIPAHQRRYKTILSQALTFLYQLCYHGHNIPTYKNLITVLHMWDIREVIFNNSNVMR